MKYGFFLLLLIPLLCGGPAIAQNSKSVATSVTISGGKWSSMRLRNLAAGTTLSVAVSADSPVAVTLADQTDFKTYPNVGNPVFQASPGKRTGFTAKVPKSGAYYVILDNRGSRKTATAKIVVRAARTSAAGNRAGKSAGLERALI